jgi:hypothetical protein
VAEGPYPQEKRAIAYSLASFSARESFIFAYFEFGNTPAASDNDHYRNACGYANCSASLGLFSYTCAALAWLLDWTIADLENRMPFKELEAFWKGYAEYRQTTGSQRPWRKRRCAKCGYKPAHKTLLKRCSGTCSRVRRTKPVYCGQKCQREVSDYPPVRQRVELDSELTYISKFVGLAIPQTIL